MQQLFRSLLRIEPIFRGKFASNSSTFPIFNRISGVLLVTIVLFFYLLCLKIGLIDFDFFHALLEKVGFSPGKRALSFALRGVGCSAGLALTVGFALQALLTGEGFTNMMAPAGDSGATWKEDTREIDILMESSWETEDTGSSVNQPVAPPVPPANPVASPGEEAGPSNRQLLDLNLPPSPSPEPGPEPEPASSSELREARKEEELGEERLRAWADSESYRQLTERLRQERIGAWGGEAECQRRDAAALLHLRKRTLGDLEREYEETRARVEVLRRHMRERQKK
jgi:hypothetical protein